MASRRNEEKPNWLERKLGKMVLFGIIALLIIAFFLGVHFSSRKNTLATDIDDAIDYAIHGEEGTVSTVTQSSLEKVVTTSRLYTAEYPYNGISAVYDSETGVLKYHVAYEGTVKAGIDVSLIQVSLNEETHEIIIRLPQVVVEEPVINAGTMEYIFEDNKYNTETVAQEAYKAAIADLRRRTAADPDILTTATQTAKSAEKALVEPWVNQVDTDIKYTVTVLGYGEE